LISRPAILSIFVEEYDPGVLGLFDRRPNDLFLVDSFPARREASRARASTVSSFA
jgi:hypothetical protein